MVPPPRAQSTISLPYQKYSMQFPSPTYSDVYGKGRSANFPHGGLLRTFESSCSFGSAILFLCVFSTLLIVLGSYFVLGELDSEIGYPFTEIGFALGIPLLFFGALFSLATLLSAYSYMKEQNKDPEPKLETRYF